jgi:hypothetical protein
MDAQLEGGASRRCLSAFVPFRHAGFRSIHFGWEPPGVGHRGREGTQRNCPELKMKNTLVPPGRSTPWNGTSSRSLGRYQRNQKGLL